MLLKILPLYKNIPPVVHRDIGFFFFYILNSDSGRVYVLDCVGIRFNCHFGTHSEKLTFTIALYGVLRTSLIYLYRKE